MHTLPPLPYDYDALEPIIDTQTMQIHHTRHHQTYIDKLNTWLSAYPQYEWLSVTDLLQQFDTLPDALKPVVRNHGGGHANHSFFWKIMCPVATSEVYKVESKVIMDAISQSFGSFESFVEQFRTAAMNQFGSGRCRLVKGHESWVASEEWLLTDSKKLSIMSTANQDNPLMQGLLPILWLDVREHAYYLKYQNKRLDYINAWFSVINWKEVEKNLIS